MFSESEAKTSNGFSAHFSINQAKQLAIFELLERDSFFCHFLTETPFRQFKLSDCLPFLPDQLKLFIENQIRREIEIKIGMMESQASGYYLFASASDASTSRKFGVILASTAGCDLQKVLTKTFLDLAVNLIWIDGVNDIKKLTRDELYNQSEYTPDIHLQYALHPENRDWFLKMFTTHCYPLPKVDFQKVENSFQYTIQQLPLPVELYEPPLVVVRAQSEDLQNHYVGLLSEENVNITRLSKFVGKDLGFKDLTTAPSIYG